MEQRFHLARLVDSSHSASKVLVLLPFSSSDHLISPKPFLPIHTINQKLAICNPRHMAKTTGYSIWLLCFK
jgi:hypothetical protein